MSRYALTSSVFVDAFDANPLDPFTCGECGGTVHLRTAKGRSPHFVHVRTTPACRLYSQTGRHLEIQLSLQKWIPDLVIEHPFPEISRVADLYWKKEKIVFEIQCSLLSDAQVQMRMHDYAQLGLQVVWLLDERLYFKRIYKQGERLMRTAGFYVGIPLRAYDAWECPVDRWRRFRGPRFSVELNRPRSAPTWRRKDPIPASFHKREGPAFWGDLRDRAERWLLRSDKRGILERWKRQESRFRWFPLRSLPQNIFFFLGEEFTHWIVN